MTVDPTWYNQDDTDPDTDAELGSDRTNMTQADGVGDLIVDDEPDGGLFQGDRGVLPLTARKALVLLLKRTHLTAITHPAEWYALLNNIEQIEVTLHHLFLELVVDKHNEVAYKRQAGREIQTRTFTTLVKDRKYTAEEAAMLLVIRQIQQTSRGLGEPATYVDRDDLHQRLMYLRPGSNDEVRDREAVDRAIDTLLKEDLLLKVQGDDERLRISPVIETILNVARVQQFRDSAYGGVPGESLTATGEPVDAEQDSLDMAPNEPDDRSGVDSERTKL